MRDDGQYRPAGPFLEAPAHTRALRHPSGKGSVICLCPEGMNVANVMQKESPCIHLSPN